MNGTYKRGKAGGTVVLSTDRDSEGNIVIQVKDNGVGFDYEQFKREVAAGKRDSTGLKNVIFRFEKLLGAKVDVQSELGVGTTVTVKVATDLKK